MLVLPRRPLAVLVCAAVLSSISCLTARGENKEAAASQSSSDRRLRAIVPLNVHHKPNGQAAVFRVLGMSDQSKNTEKSIKEHPTSE